MEENKFEIITNEVEFDQELYEINITENEFEDTDELDGIGLDESEVA